MTDLSTMKKNWQMNKVDKSLVTMSHRNDTVSDKIRISTDFDITIRQRHTLIYSADSILSPY